jgi:hypothetical protein
MQMPTLAREIVNQNAAGATPKLNFKGFAVGNPATNMYSTIPASMEAYWYVYIYVCVIACMCLQTRI